MNGRFYCRATIFPILLLSSIASTTLARAADTDEGFTPLFNGKDLTGWVNVDGGPSTFVVKDGEIITNGIPEAYLRTEKPYENFILDLDWMHVTKGGNSGLFVWADALPDVGAPWPRSYENQILDGRETANYTSDGDLFAIHGAFFKPDRPHPAGWMRCLPSEKRSHPFGEWNHYRIECNDGVIKLAVNGKVVSGGSEANPRTGYICLESEERECRFKNIRVKELPTSNPKPELMGKVDEGFKCIYTGDLTGWTGDPAAMEHWKPKRWILTTDGKGDAAQQTIWTQKKYRDCILMFDWRLPAEPRKERGATTRPTAQSPALTTQGLGTLILLRAPSTHGIQLGTAGRAKPAGQWNRFIVTLRQGSSSLELNGEVVSPDALHVPGGANALPIGISYLGEPIEFANFFVKELDEKQ